MARIVFLQKIWHEYGGPEIISAVLKKHGHNTDLLIGKDASVFINKVQKNDIIAFSAMSGEHHWALEIAARIKKEKDVLTVFGGAHPTYFPEIIKHPAVDVSCCGEGEFAMLDLANAHDRGVSHENIANLSEKRGGGIKENDVRPLVGDLDALPFPDRDIYYNRYPLLKKSRLKPFMASRGCPFSCSFCFNEKLRGIYSDKGRYVRFRSPGNVIDEIKDVEKKYGLDSIYFVDDLFALNKTWLKKFTDIYKKEIKKPFVCSTHINALNEDIIRLLKDSGCATVSFGIETGNERLRHQLLNKHITNKQIKEMCLLFKKHNLKFMTFNMVGIPGETIRNVWETINLNIEIGTEYPRCSILTAYPGTRIAESHKDKIRVKDIETHYQQSEVSFEVPRLKELYNLHSFFQTAVIFPRSAGLIKRLIKFPPNVLFKLWWAIVYSIVFVKSEQRSFFQTFIFVFKTFGF